MNARAHLTVVSPAVLPEPPYPPETLAKGWRFELDYERIRRSKTWTLAPAEVRPWLLMLWLTAWEQAPCGTLENDDELIAARIGMSTRQFAAWRDVLMRGWTLHSDGLLYHPTITEFVLAMATHRVKESARVAAWRAKKVQEGAVTRNQRMSTTPEPEPEPEPDKEIPVAIATGGIDAADAASDPEPTDPPGGLPDCPAQKLVDLYHAKLPALPQCLVLTKTRRGYLRARWREYAEQNEWKTEADGLEFFADYFAHVARSKFLTGRASGRDGRPPFVADLEWLFRPTNFAKVVEGKYHA